MSKQEIGRLSRRHKFAKVYCYDDESHYADLSQQRKASDKLDAIANVQMSQAAIKPSANMNLMIEFCKDRFIHDQCYSIPKALLDVCNAPRSVHPDVAVTELVRITSQPPGPVVAAIADKAAHGGEDVVFFRVVDVRPESKFTVNYVLPPK